MNGELTCGSLFSGVGGMDIGLRRAGYRHLFLAEIDAYCRAVLAARFPGVPIYDDVRAVDEGAGYVDLLCGGFPCQDLSVAGKRAGLAGDRSGLFFEFMRVVDALRPRAVLIENVEGLYSSGSPKGADFGVVLDSLAERGYLASWRTLDAQHFGVPQRRRRVFVCAIADGDPGAERLGEVLAVTEGSVGDSQARDPSWPLSPAPVGDSPAGGGGVDAVTVERERERESHPGCHGKVGEGQRRASGRRVPEPRVVGALSARGYTKYTDQEFVRGGQLVTDRDLREREREVPVGVNPSNPDIAGTLPSNAQGGQRTTDIAGAFVCGFSHTQGLDPQATEERTPTLRKNGGGMAAGVGSTVRRLTPLECERLMGWPDGWTDIPWNKKDHAPDSRRYAACGNGVVAPVAYWIAARLAEVLK